MSPGYRGGALSGFGWGAQRRAGEKQVVGHQELRGGENTLPPAAVRITDDDANDPIRNPRAVLKGEAAMGHDPAGITGSVRLHYVFATLTLVVRAHRQPSGFVHLAHLLHRQRKDRFAPTRLLVRCGAERAHLAVRRRPLEPDLIARFESTPSFAREFLELRRANHRDHVETYLLMTNL